MTFVRVLGYVFVMAGAIPLAYLALLGLTRWLPERKRQAPPLRVAVLIPAHNEAETIGQLLSDLKGQTRPPAVVLVVAHNCSDRTADVAREAGADVLPLETGREKTDALKAGLHWLDGREWDAVLIVDADCRLNPDCIERLYGTPKDVAQGRIVGDPLAASGLMFSMFGRLEDAIFHRGRARMGFFALLRGTGVLLGRDALARCPWGAGGLTEDRGQTYAFLSAGIPTRLEPHIMVMARPPERVEQGWNQRRRWLSTGLPAHLAGATRAAARAAPRLGWKAWELPLAAWTDARSQWLLLLMFGTLLLSLSGGSYEWGLALLAGAALVAVVLGVIWYRGQFFRGLLEVPRSAAIVFGAALFSLAGRRPTAWKRGR
jgi:cellulose synthase/poly-beta-1,6-N-acetylglucosamine synthase-like glycosyltransferase